MINQTHTFVWFFPAEKLPIDRQDSIFFVVKSASGTADLIKGYFRSEDSMFVEESSNLEDVSSWSIDEVTIWTSMSNFLLSISNHI